MSKFGVLEGAGGAIVLRVNRALFARKVLRLERCGIVSMRLDLRGVGYRLFLVFLVGFCM